MIIETKRFTNVIEMPSCKTWAKGDHGSKKEGGSASALRGVKQMI